MKYNLFENIFALIDVISNPISLIGCAVSIIINICVIYLVRQKVRKSYIVFIPAIISGIITIIGIWGCVYGGADSLTYLGVTLFSIPFLIITTITISIYYIIKYITQNYK